MPLAINPAGTDLLAEVNSSMDVVLKLVYLFWIHEIPIMRKVKKNPILHSSITWYSSDTYRTCLHEAVIGPNRTALPQHHTITSGLWQ